MDKLRQERHRSTTRKNYYAVWCIFNEFFIKLDIKPNNWEDRLTLFVGYLIENGKKSSTICSYISAVKAVLCEDNVVISEDRYLLTSLTKACKYKNDQVRLRLPVQKGLLHIILDQATKHFDEQGQLYLKFLYRAIFAVAYFGLLWVGELASGEHPIKAVDVFIADNKDKLVLILRTSKTHWKDSPPPPPTEGFYL